MTKISHLQISGFKAIEDLEVEPKRINIITGRNNTGKTSFLESIDIGFNPEHIERFSDNLDKVINVQGDNSLIDIKFRQDKQTNLADFDDQGSQSHNREVVIRNPDESEAMELFSRTLEEVLQLNEDYPMRVHPGLRRRISGEEISSDDLEEIEDLIHGILQDTSAEFPERTILPDIMSNSLIIHVNGKEYKYIHLGDYYRNTRDEIINESISRITDESQQVFEKFDEPIQENVEQILTSVFNSRLSPRFGSDRFVGESPDEIKGVKMIESPIESAKNADMSEENAAIKASNIEDYLQQNKIVDDLSDFSFDKLVLDDGGEKYEVPFSFTGDGFQTIVGLLWEMFSTESQGNVLLLEEPGNHMHPGYIENFLVELVKIMRREHLQLFITTHNLDLIEAFFSEHMQEEEGEFLSKNLQILQMTEPVSRSLDYNSANEEIEELNVDLRGI